MLSIQPQFIWRAKLTHFEQQTSGKNLEDVTEIFENPNGLPYIGVSTQTHSEKFEVLTTTPSDSRLEDQERLRRHQPCRSWRRAGRQDCIRRGPLGARGEGLKAAKWLSLPVTGWKDQQRLANLNRGQQCHSNTRIQVVIPT